MGENIVLTVRAGEAYGKEFVFHDHTLCTVGRSKNCLLQLSNPAVSRRHCLLDIEPPIIRIRDLGSRNGTFVNGVNIGRRERKEGGDSDVQKDMAELELHERDMIRVGSTVF